MRSRILLVEDNDILRLLIVDALSTINIDVIECDTADAGLIALEQCSDIASIALIMTDIRTPGALDGFDLAKIVWQRWPKLPVILTSGHRSIADSELPTNSCFMAKPWMLDQLYETIDHQLNKRQSIQQTSL